MTQQQFEQRIITSGGNEREAEILAMRVYPEWRDMQATKITRQQAQDICTLLFDLREEDQQNAWIDNKHINAMHSAGYVVRGVCFVGNR